MTGLRLCRIVVLVLVPVFGAAIGLAEDLSRPGPSLRDIAVQAEQIKARSTELLAQGAAGQETEKKRLQAEAAQLSARAAQAKARALALEERLQVLRQEEAALSQATAGHDDLLRLMQTTVAGNARILHEELRASTLSRPDPAGRDRVRQLTQEQEFPDLDDVADLLTLLEEAVDASGRITRRQEEIVGRDGAVRLAEVLRLGSSQAVYADGSDSGFLLPPAGEGMLRAAPRLPTDQEAAAIRAAMAGGLALPLDFSAGRLPASPAHSPGLMSRVREGGLFVWPILLIGLLGACLILERCVVLSRIRIIGRNPGDIQPSADPRSASPARRVAAYMLAEGPGPAEKLEMRMEEAVLAELPRLERFLQTLRIMAAIAPLLGLLGTVSGIIQTFRVIAVHGSGDPKLLSAGISEALVTTEMGLVVAIPLLLCHHFLSRRVSRVILDMEMAGAAVISAGLEARHD